jgi:hypothetical protein
MLIVTAVNTNDSLRKATGLCDVCVSVCLSLCHPWNNESIFFEFMNFYMAATAL